VRNEELKSWNTKAALDFGRWGSKGRAVGFESPLPLLKQIIKTKDIILNITVEKTMGMNCMTL